MREYFEELYGYLFLEKWSHKKVTAIKKQKPIELQLFCTT